MTSTNSFKSWLASYFEDFVALRHATGSRYESQRRRLVAFDRYLSDQATPPPLSGEILQSYLATLDHLSPRSRRQPPNPTGDGEWDGDAAASARSLANDASSPIPLAIAGVAGTR